MNQRHRVAPHHLPHLASCKRGVGLPGATGPRPPDAPNPLIFRMFMVRLEGKSLNSLFEALQAWEQQLAHFDLHDLKCDDEKLRA